jgi:hypothetical protein
VLAALEGYLRQLQKPVITLPMLRKLEAEESAEAQKRNLEDFKFSSNAEMFAVMGV